MLAVNIHQVHQNAAFVHLCKTCKTKDFCSKKNAPLVEYAVVVIYCCQSTEKYAGVT